MEAAIATEEAAIEKEKISFTEKEKALQETQHAFNELNNIVRGKENEKNLATQRLQYLREREENLSQFLSRAEGQITGIEESISFTQKQITALVYVLRC